MLEGNVMLKGRGWGVGRRGMLEGREGSVRLKGPAVGGWGVVMLEGGVMLKRGRGGAAA